MKIVNLRTSKNNHKIFLFGKVLWYFLVVLAEMLVSLQ